MECHGPLLVVVDQMLEVPGAFVTPHPLVDHCGKAIAISPKSQNFDGWYQRK
jgi:hypothetical protein